MSFEKSNRTMLILFLERGVRREEGEKRGKNEERGARREECGERCG